MKPGDLLEICELITGHKKNVYAKPQDLAVLITDAYSPVLLVHMYGNPNKTFPVKVEATTTTLSKANVQRLKKENKNA